MGRPARVLGGATGRKLAPPAILLILWTGFIAYGTLLPFDFRADPAMAASKLRGLPAAFDRMPSRADVASNILLFLPWGFLYAIRAAGRGSRLGWAVVGAATGGLALSALVESAQLFLPSRTTSPIDLATNTAGATLGAAAGWALARRRWPTWSPRLEGLARRRPMATCALVAAAGLAVAGLSPFDVSLDLGDLKASIKAARPIPFGPPLRGPVPPARPWSRAEEVVTWALFGGLVALAAREAGSRGPRATVGCAAFCGALASAIEVAQLAIPGRTTDATTVVFAAIGASAGAAAIASDPGRDARRWVGPALALWAVAVTLAAWTPPHLAPPGRWAPGWSQLVPFWSYYRRTDLHALADLVEQVLAFLPLGALLAARGVRRPIGWALLLGFGLGSILEAGQLPLAGRTAEITDALSAGAGAAIGARLWGWGTEDRAGERGRRRVR